MTKDNSIWLMMAATHRRELEECTRTNIFSRFKTAQEDKDEDFTIKRRDFNLDKDVPNIDNLYKQEINTLFYYLNKEDGHLYLENSEDAKTVCKLIKKYEFCFERNEVEHKKIKELRKKIKKYIKD